MRSCLDALPHEYGPANTDLSDRVTTCLGATLAERWDARNCVPFEVATDVTNGRKLEAYLACSDLCPDYVHTGIRYVDVHQPECECLGGNSVGPEDSGCAPGGRSRAEGPDSFEVVGSSGHYEIKAKGPFPHVRLAYLGLQRQVDSVNGHRTTDAASLTGIVRRLIAQPPADVRFWQSGNTRVVYAERSAIDHLAALMSTLSFATAAQSLACPAPDGPAQATLCVGDRALRCDTAHDLACATFASDIEKAAGDPKAPRGHKRIDCADLRRLPTFVAVRFHDRTIELRYVDWMPQLSDGS